MPGRQRDRRTMVAHCLDKLEYPAIVERLASCCHSEPGRQQAAGLSPATDLETAQLRLQETAAAFFLLEEEQLPPLDDFASPAPALARAQKGGVLGADTLLALAQLGQLSSEMKRYLEGQQELEEAASLLHYSDYLYDFSGLVKAIERAIDETGEVKDDASSELASIRRRQRTLNRRVRERLEGMVRSQQQSGHLQDSLITMRGGRYVLPVRRESREQVKGIVHDQSSSGATLFVEPAAVVEMNNQLRDLEAAEKREVQRILAGLSDQAAELATPLELAAATLAQLDFVFAKARLAQSMDAVPPQLHGGRGLRLEGARHPLIDPAEVVPVDLLLGQTFQALVVTGPNTGGKTVALKTAGLLTAMAVSGLFVPAENGASVPVVDAIYCDIGDEQSIEQNLSTFSSHMTTIRDICSHASERSLVLLDEIGAGTDPYEGSALAIEILRYLYQKGCLLMATTHYGQLKAFAYNEEGFQNASVEFNTETLEPTYRLSIGLPGRSNALDIARRIGLEPAILDAAGGHVSEDEHDIQGLIRDMEERRRQVDQELEQAKRERQTAERLRQRHEQELEKLKERKQREVEKARKRLADRTEKLEQEVRQLASQLQSLIDRNRELERNLASGQQGEEDELADAQRQLEQARQSFKREAELAREAMQEDEASQPAAKERSPVRIEEGDAVFVVPLNQPGTVTAVDEDREQATVQVGRLRTEVALAELRPRQDEQAGPAVPLQSKSQANRIRRSKMTGVDTEIHLRMLTRDEALRRLDKYLDDAFLAGLSQVRIIHGKGEGILRRTVHEYLNHHRHVLDYRLGERGEGGFGVTIARLKD